MSYYPPAYDGKVQPLQSNEQLPYAPAAGPTASSGQNEKFNFTGGVKYHDLWATVLFIVNFLVFIFLSISGIAHLSQKAADSTTVTPSANEPVATIPPLDDSSRSALIGVLAGFTAIGAVISYLYLVLLRKFPAAVIHGTFIGGIILNFGLALLYFASGVAIAGVIFVIIGVLNLILYFFWRKYIPFTAAILETVVEIGNKYPASYFFAFLSLVLGTVYQIWWAVGLAGAADQYENATNSTPQKLVIIFMVFSFYWTMQIFRNTLHVTVSGTISAYYFLYGTAAMPANPSLEAAKRAFTSSFGPIAFGSLIVAIIQTIRYLLRSAARDGSIVAAIADCFLSCIEGLVQYFNSYAYIQVAIYGKSFMRAAKDTWSLLISTGFEAVINDSFVSTVVGMGAFINGLLLGGLGYLALKMAMTAAQADTYLAYMIGVAVILFLIGFTMIMVIGMYLESAVSTLYVCLAEEPAVLYRTKPQLYQKFREAYPSVSWRF